AGFMTFAFASINVMGDDVADATRVIKLELTLHDSDFNARREIESELAYFEKAGGDGWCNAMVERLPVLLDTIKVLEAQIRVKDDRHRKNMSVLLAGAWTALSNKVPSEQEAKDYVAQAAATIALHGDELERDEAQECFDRLLAKPVRADYPFEA